MMFPMAFHVRHRYGGNDSDPPLEAFEALLDELLVTGAAGLRPCVVGGRRRELECRVR
jgi:hypothetical protein